MGVNEMAGRPHLVRLNIVLDAEDKFDARTQILHLLEGHMITYAIHEVIGPDDK